MSPAVKTWTVTFTDDEEMYARREDKARRAAHIDFVRKARDAGWQFDIGGPLAMTPMQDFPGAVWTVEARSREEVQELLHRDPYFAPRLRRYKITEKPAAVPGKPSLMGLFS